MKKTYTKPEIHVEEMKLGVFGNYGQPDPVKPDLPINIMNERGWFE